MTEHLPECWATYPSDPPAWCICDELRACKERVLNAAREAVEAIPAPYKIRGDFDTFGPHAEGKADFKDLALSAIDALRDRETPPPLPPSVGVPERRWT